MSCTVSYHHLACGAELVTLPTAGAHTIALGAWLHSGTRDELPERNGIAHFLEHMVFKGSNSRNTLQLSQAFETIGGTIDAYTTHECTAYSLQVLPEHLDVGCELLAELIIHASLDPNNVETEKGVVAEEIHESNDSAGDTAADLCSHQAWGDHPLGRPVLGVLDTLATLSADDMHAWRDRQYIGPRLVLAVAGAVDVDRVVDTVNRWFADLPCAGDPIDQSAPTFHTGVATRRLSAEQVAIDLAAPAPSADSPERYAMWIIDVLLGSTTNSRLFQEVRERRGLAYQVGSSYQRVHDVGLLVIDATASPGKVEELLKVTRGAVDRFLDEGISDAELAWVKKYYATTQRLADDLIVARMSSLAGSYFYHRRYVPLDEALAAVNALTREDVMATARKVLGAGQWVLAAAGPVTD